MRRAARIVLILAAVVLLVPVLGVAAILVALNTAPGRAFAETQIAGLTGGTVVPTGLGGRFPDRLRLAHLELRDTDGLYFSLNDVALDWSPAALLHRQALIHSLTAATLDFVRLPVPDPNARRTPSDPGARPFTLPVRVTVESLAVARATLGGRLLGTPATLAVTAKADLPTLDSGTATIDATRSDGAPARYTLDATVADTIQAHLTVDEPENGLVATLAGLPAIGAIRLDATTAGPRTALSTKLALTAGPLTATATALIDSVGNTLTADIAARAPAMRPAEGVAWRAIDLQAHVAGPFATPDATGHLIVQALEAQGASIATLTADLAGNAGQVTVRAQADTVRIPGPNPALLAAAPLHADITARLDEPARPVRFSLTHPLIGLAGTARTAGALAADAVLTLPDLAPLAALAGLDLAGRTTLNLHAAQPRTGSPDGASTLAADGTIALTGGPAPAPVLIGDNARIEIAATTAGSTVTVTKAHIQGAALTLDATGQTTPAGLDATARLALSNLSLIAPTLTGAATMDAHAKGPLDALAVNATIAGDVGAPGVPRGPVKLTAALTGLPAAPAGRITGTGVFQGAPLALSLDAARDASGTLRATIDRADWRSLHAEGALTLPPGATMPTGTIRLHFPTLADLRPLIGQPLAGGLTATLALDPAAVTLEADLRNAGLPGRQAARAQLKARVASPLRTPSVTATLIADGFEASGTTGSARLEVAGPLTALAIRASANVIASGTPAQLTMAALLDAPAQRMRLNALQIDAKPPGYSAPETIRLTAPAMLRLAEIITVDRLRLAIRSTTLDIAGRLSPTLDATVALKASAADLPLPRADGQANPYQGQIALDAKLSGTAAAPTGTVRLNATGLRARTGPAQTLPPASLVATAQLAGGSARVDARIVAGSANLALNGQAPLGAGALALRATGALDLALLDPILAAEARRARGRLSLDATITGTAAAPRVAGTAQLVDGEIQDFAQGARIDRIAATLRADGQTIRLVSLTGRAGPGTIAASGTIGLQPPNLDLVITARNARPLASDTISADLDADLTVKGPLAAPTAGGTIRIRRAELGIPSTLPASVAVLDVRRPGQKPAAPAAPGSPIALDLTIDAPNQVFVRGRGVNAEMAGSLRIRGTSAQPQVGGGLTMRRGTVSVAGTTLTFSRGKVGFDGTGIGGKIDPTLDFAADSSAGGVTATLAIGGYVSKPKITLSSIPDLPQDEVLAYLIFKRSAKDLGPFQIAQIAAGLAELTGVGGGGFNPLEDVRKGLGLDRLSLGTGSGTGTSTKAAAPTVEAGRYVANGVYVGAKQGATGNETGATVQIDITKGLKLQTDVGTGQGGNQVGVTYQYEY